MKLVKLSVVAAMAAGLATSASAVELTEAIKGVDISGYVRYRLESDGGSDDDGILAMNTDDNQHKYKYRVKATVPVNDDVNFVALVGNDGTNGIADGGGEAVLSDLTYGTSAMGVIHAYFQYTGVENLVVQVGKQPMPTPFNDDEHGNGLVALYNVGPVTLAGGYFDSQNATPAAVNGLGSNDDVHTNVVALGVIGSVEMVNFSAWYADHENTFDAWTVDVNADIMDMVNVGIRHTQLKFDSYLDDYGFDQEKNKLTKLYASADIEMINLRAGYARTADEGGFVNYDADAATGFLLEQADLTNLPNAKAFHLGVGASLDKFTLGLDYVDGKFDDSDGDAHGLTRAEGLEGDFSEIMPSVKYQMSDNFYISALHSIYKQEVDGTGKDKRTLSRVEVKYSF